MTTTRLNIPEMDCPGEGNPIEQALRKVKGVTQVFNDYANRQSIVTHDDVNVALLLDAVNRLGFECEEYVEKRRRQTLSVPELCCESEAQQIQKLLAPMNFEDLECNLVTRTVLLTAEPFEVEKAIELLKNGGFTAHPMVQKAAPVEHPDLPWTRFGIALVFALLSEVMDLWVEYHPESLPIPERWAHIAIVILALIAVLLSGLATLRRGLVALSRFNFNMNALMAVAVIGGLAIQAYPEAAMVMVLFEISEAIEDLSMAKARRSIRELMSVTPETALMQWPDGQFKETKVDVIGPGSVVRVAPGDRVPLDGKILRGATSLDQSMVTGEGLPAEKTIGDTVWAGTVNLTASIDVKVTAAASESLTARIIDAVENAQANKSPVQRFVDKFALVYTPTVFAVALCVAIIPPLFVGDWLGWVYKALVCLVIACPCALVISTPVTLVSALATATRCGLLIKGGLYLEQARLLKNVALDKTGTLTKGEPEVVGVVWIDDAGKDNALAAAYSLASMNKHPLSRSLVAWSKHEGVRLQDVDNFKAIAGSGVEGQVKGQRYSLVNLRWLESMGLSSPEIKEAFENFHRQGCSAVALADLFGVRVIFGFADKLKSDALEGLKQLEDVGLTPWLLTGDHQAAADQLARETGLKHIKAELLPEDKLSHIEALQKTGLTAMVGDGINDAPALARADIGVAMGIKGTDSAIEAAHVAVMDDRISSLATLVRLSRMTHRVLVQNITFALTIKALFIIMALSGLATMWMAVFADTGTCLIVIFNGTRMLRVKPKLDQMQALANQKA